MASPLDLLNSYKQKFSNAISQPKPSTTVGTGGSRSVFDQNLRGGFNQFQPGLSGRYAPKGSPEFPVKQRSGLGATPSIPSKNTSLVNRLFEPTSEKKFNKEYSTNKPAKKSQPAHTVTSQTQTNIDARAGRNAQTRLDRGIKNGSVTGGLRNSLVGAAVYAIGDALIPHISREAVRGAMVVTGQDTTNYDAAYLQGKPVVKNVGGVSYNIATEEGMAGYRKATAKGEKPSAPAKPAVSRGQNLPPSAAVPGTGPKGNEVGSDADPNTPGLQGPGAPGARVNANGLVSYGKDLSSLNAFTSAFTGGYEIADIKSSFQSNDLPSAYQNGSNSISTEDSKYTLNAGATPSNVGGKYTMSGVDTSIRNTGYKIDGKSVPGSLGGNPADPQDGTSDKPDVAESIRQVRMERQSGRGSRRDPRNRGEDPDMFGGPEPSDASLVSPMYSNKKRNAIRDAFFAGETSVKGAVAANAVAGYGKDSDGRARVNYGGKLYNFKDGMEHKGRNALMEGRPEDAMQYLDMPEVDTQPDTPAASELSPAPASTVKPGTIQMPENGGGSIEAPEPILKVDPVKQKEAEDFMSSHISMLTRKTK